MREINNKVQLNMKKSKDKSKTRIDKYDICIYIGVLSAVLLIFVYFLWFRDGISRNTADWSNFGAYYSGALMPILTGLNIYVFIKLTREIELERRNRENEQAQNREIELQRQREMQMAELRFEEVKNLNNVLEATFKSITKCETEIPPTITKASKTISSFMYNFGTLFQVDEKRYHIFQMCLIEIDTELLCLQRDGWDSMYALSKEDIKKMHHLKDELIRSLYAITFGKEEKWSKETYDYLNIKQN